MGTSLCDTRELIRRVPFIHLNKISEWPMVSWAQTDVTALQWLTRQMRALLHDSSYARGRKLGSKQEQHAALTLHRGY